MEGTIEKRKQFGSTEDAQYLAAIDLLASRVAKGGIDTDISDQVTVNFEG